MRRKLSNNDCFGLQAYIDCLDLWLEIIEY